MLTRTSNATDYPPSLDIAKKSTGKKWTTKNSFDSLQTRTWKQKHSRDDQQPPLPCTLSQMEERGQYVSNVPSVPCRATKRPCGLGRNALGRTSEHTVDQVKVHELQCLGVEYWRAREETRTRATQAGFMRGQGCSI